MKPPGHDGSRSFDLLAIGLLASARGNVRSARPGAPLCGANGRHADPISLRPTPERGAGFLEQACDGRSADPTVVRKLQDAHAGSVFLDKIVDARRVNFSGHVYNLQTDAGFYIASGIVTHNCRCSLEMRTNLDMLDSAPSTAPAEDDLSDDEAA